MTIEQAWFVLEHGSAEGLQAYLEAIKTIKKNCVEIVRCRDCEHCYFASNRVPDERSYACGKHGIDVTPDWYCADGKKRENFRKPVSISATDWEGINCE